MASANTRPAIIDPGYEEALLEHFGEYCKSYAVADPQLVLVDQPEKKKEEGIDFHDKMERDTTAALTTVFNSKGINFETVNRHTLEIQTKRFEGEGFMWVFYAYKNELLMKIFVDATGGKLSYQIFLSAPKSYHVAGRA